MAEMAVHIWRVNNRRPVVAGAVAVALLIVGLLFVDVRAATSSVSANSAVSTASSRPSMTTSTGEKAGGSDGGLYLYVEGEDVVTEAFRRWLPAILEAERHFGRVMLLDARPAVGNHPVVVAAISEQQMMWTPVYGRVNTRIRFAYASDKGDLSWRDEGPSVFDGTEPAVRIRGDVNVMDKTYGLISRPAYADHVGRAIAEHVGKELGQALEKAPDKN